MDDISSTEEERIADLRRQWADARASSDRELGRLGDEPALFLPTPAQLEAAMHTGDFRGMDLRGKMISAVDSVGVPASWLQGATQLAFGERISQMPI